MADTDKDTKAKIKRAPTGGPVGWTLFVCYFGALVYFIQHAHGFWRIVFAFIQAAIWPGYVLYHVLQVLRV